MGIAVMKNKMFAQNLFAHVSEKKTFIKKHILGKPVTISPINIDRPSVTRPDIMTLTQR